MIDRLPHGFAAEVERIRESTRSLMAAACAGDAEAIQRAIEKRGVAVDALRRLLDDPTSAVSESDRARVLESIALQAQDAAGDLAGLQERIRDDLLSLNRGAKAVRGYHKNHSQSLPDRSALDRSG